MLLELFEKHNKDVEKLIGISKSKATYQKYEVTRKHITRSFETWLSMTLLSILFISFIVKTTYFSTNDAKNNVKSVISSLTLAFSNAAIYSFRLSTGIIVQL